MLSVEQVLIDGIILSLVLSVLIFGSLAYNPRLWLQDYPTAMQQRVPPLTNHEKRVQRLFIVPFMLSFLGITYLSTANFSTFLTAYLNAFLVLNIFNLFDAVVIDLLILTFMRPGFVILPGTEDLVDEFNDWGMHLRNYLKGIVVSAVIALPVALAAVLL